MRLVPMLPLVLVPLTATSTAQTIDFESIPGGTPAELLSIENQFNVAPYFVTFHCVHPTLGLRPATLAKLGPPRKAFRGPGGPDLCNGGNTQADNPASNLSYDPGCFFLTDDGEVGNSSDDIQSIVVTYGVPVTQASGYILDIDFGEEFMIHARGRDDGDLVGVPPIPLGPSGDGGASFWAFDTQAPIYSILIAYTGTSSTKGIAFDQFSPSTSCPSQVEHYGTGLAGVFGIPSISLGCPSAGHDLVAQVHQGFPGVHGCLVIGMQGPANIPMASGGTLWVRPPMAVVDAHQLDGAGSLVRNLGPLSISLLGLELSAQAAYFDTTAPGGISFTGAVSATVSM